MEVVTHQHQEVSLNVFSTELFRQIRVLHSVEDIHDVDSDDKGIQIIYYPGSLASLWIGT